MAYEYKRGDKVRRTDGQPFSFGEIGTVDRVVKAPFEHDAIYLQESGRFVIPGQVKLVTVATHNR